jgi:hypothetical protein
MSAGIKITNGDITFNPQSKRVDLIFDEEKAVQLAIHTISFDIRRDNKGAGINELVGLASNELFFTSRINSSIQLAFGNVIRDQTRTPRVTKTRKEIITEVTDLIVERSVDDPRNYDIELTIVLLDGQTFVINGILN